jgi:uncharacterized protein YhbP (UPF0306 family)
MEKELLKKHILDLMKKSLVASIATSVNSKPWVANVFFTNDSDLNIYFLSSTKTRHSLEAVQNSSVAVSIYDKESTYDFVHGIQIEGEIKEANLVDIMKSLKSYIEKYPESTNKLQDPKTLVDSLSSSRMYIIHPTSVKYLNSTLKASEGTSNFTYFVSEVSSKH